MKFTDLLDYYRIPYRTEGQHTRAGWIQMDCCFCGGPMYLGYKIAAGYCSCWRCGPHTAVQTVCKAAGIKYGPGLDELRKLISRLDREFVIPEEKLHKLEYPPGIGRLRKAHINYLQNVRRFDPVMLQDLWKIQGIGLDGGRLKWRIFIPIHYCGKVVSWTTRSISDKAQARYISASNEQEAIHHKELLFGEDYCRHSIIVHEGPFDVFATGPGAVCTFGTGFTPAQVEKISKYPVRVVCFDNEPEAQKRARLLCDALEVFPGETLCIRLKAKDVAESSEKERKQLRHFLEA